MKNLFLSKKKIEEAEAGWNADMIYRQNEDKANKFAEMITIITYLALILDYIINYASLESRGRKLYGIIYLIVAGISLILTLIFNHCTSEKEFRKRKYYIMLTTIFVVAGFHDIFSGTFYVAIPFIFAMSCRYYDIKFLNRTAAAMAVILAAMGFLGYKYLGVLDVNMLEIKPGTSIMIPVTSTWVGDGVRGLVLADSSVVLGYAHNYVFACVLEFVLLYILFLGINLSGKEMLAKAALDAKNKAAIEEDLSIARNIQKSMLPTEFENYKGNEYVDIFAIMNASYEVGGDFYDFFAVDDDKVCLVIGDVSGKGVPAALFMVRAQTTIRGLAELGISPNQILDRANNILCENNAEHFFVTAWIGILNLGTGVLSYAIAGHNPPLLCKDGEGYNYMESRLELPDADNVAMGIMPAMIYSHFTVCLKAGDKLLLYTDGVTDAKNSGGERFGNERLEKYLNENDCSCSKDVVDIILDAIADFSNGESQFDDITMLSMQLKKGQN